MAAAEPESTEIQPNELPAFGSPAMGALLLLAIVFALHAARDFFLPVVLALLLSFVFAPLVRLLRRARLPPAVAAAVVVIGAVGALIYGIYQLAQPAADWVARAPQELRTIEARVRPWRLPVERVQEATEEVGRIAGADPETETVAVKPKGIGWRLMVRTASFLATAAAVIMLLYFLLASGDFFLRKVIRVLPDHEARANAVEIARLVEAEVSKYLFMVSAINVGVGVVLAGVFAWVGLPNPLLWGVLAGSLAFIPYIGHWIGIAAVGAAGLVTLEDPRRALLAMGLYALVAFVEGNLVSPLLMGRRMVLNPVAVFVGLLLWTWIWGLPGAFLAVPILATVKILCDHLPKWSTLGEFLGR
jgi:predicted PurR-regulated permease PerM